MPLPHFIMGHHNRTTRIWVVEPGGFMDLTEARDAARPGDLIRVHPGTYTLASDQQLLRSEVNWEFLTGSKVRKASGATVGIFDDTFIGAVTCRITGHGYFEHDAGAGLSFGMTTGGASDIYFEGYRFKTLSGPGILFGGGQLTLNRLRIDSSTVNSAVNVPLWVNEDGLCIHGVQLIAPALAEPIYATGFLKVVKNIASAANRPTISVMVNDGDEGQLTIVSNL